MRLAKSAPGSLRIVQSHDFAIRIAVIVATVYFNCAMPPPPVEINPGYNYTICNRKFFSHRAVTLPVVDSHPS